MSEQSISLTKELAQRFARFSHPKVLQRMLARLETQTVEVNGNGVQPLKNLASLSTIEPATGLLDAWASALDVLSFYQQRFNQENYLATATEIRSIRELAYAVGYELEPGIAASTYLAFTIEEDANNTGIASIAQGTQVLSVPRNDELPQLFETSEDYVARAEWNQLYPAQESLARLQTIQGATTRIKLAGTNYNIEAGAVVILQGTYNNQAIAYALTIQQVEADEQNEVTYISWQQDWAKAANEVSGADTTLPADATLDQPKLWLLTQQSPLFGYNFGTSELVYQLLQSDSQLVLLGSDKTATIPGTTLGLSKGDRLIVQGKKGDATVAYYLKLVEVSTSQITFQESWADATADLSGQNLGLSDNERLLEPKFWLLRQRDELLGLNLDSNIDPHLWQDSRGNLHQNGEIYLSQSLPNLLAGSWVLLKTAEKQRFYRIKDLHEQTITDFGLSDRVSVLSLSQMTGIASLSDYDEDFTVRTTTAYLASVSLELAVDMVLDDSVIQQRTHSIKLDRRIMHPPIGQRLVIVILPDEASETVALAGPATFDEKTKQVTLTLAQAPRYAYQPNTLAIKTADMDKAILVQLVSSSDQSYQLIFNALHNPLAEDVRELTLSGLPEQYSEVFKLASAQDKGNQTWLNFEQDLQYAYPPALTMIYANIVPATHGETVTEVLGSGNGAMRNQRFSLQKAPLTYLPAATAKGIQAALEIRVNGVLWQEADNLYELDANSRCYMLLNTEQGYTDVLFGDGDKGARLPTGEDNVVATYRYGSGLAGVLPAGSLTLLQTNPQGVSAVTNPVAATGGAEPETIDQVRQDLPQTVLALGRIVSLRDYESFIQTYVGIAKAQAVMLQDKQGLLVYVTVISKNFADPLQTGSLLYQSLVEAVKAVSNAGQKFEISECERVSFDIQAMLKITSGYQAAIVIQNAKQALQDYFSPTNRELGQAVTGTEIIQRLQQVAGVTAVDLNLLDFTLRLEDVEPKLNSVLTAKTARVSTKGNEPAQLLVLNAIDLGEM